MSLHLAGMQFQGRVAQMRECATGAMQVATSNLEFLETETTSQIPLEKSKSGAAACADRILSQCKAGEIQRRLAHRFGSDTEMLDRALSPPENEINNANTAELF